MLPMVGYSPLPPLFGEDASYKVECLFAHEDRGSHSCPKKLYLIKWPGYALEHNSLGPESNLSVEVLKSIGMQHPSQKTCLHAMVLEDSTLGDLVIVKGIKGLHTSWDYDVRQCSHLVSNDL